MVKPKPALFVDSDEEDISGSENESSSGDENEVEMDQVIEGSDVEVEDEDEDSEDEGEEDDGEDDTASSRKKKKKRNRKDKTKISKKEAKELKEKEHTLDSNLYLVQIKEILKEISISEEKKALAQTWLKDFKKFLRKNEPSEAFPLTDVEAFVKGVHLPLPDCVKIEEKSTDTIMWIPPSKVSIVGSWGSDTAVENVSAVDIVLEMPEELFRTSDYLNHRYHIKRAAYLAYVAKLLEKRGDTVSFTLQHGNPIKPIVSVDCTDFVVQIFAICSAVFKPTRFLPEKNNLRFGHFLGRDLPEDEPEFATPNYNYSIVTDVLLNESNEDVHSEIESSDSFKNAVKILKVWLRQRNLDKAFGSFSGFLVAAYIAYLSKTGKIGKMMTTYDVIRIFFANLCVEDLMSSGISFCDDVSIADWMLQFDVVFLNKSGMFNYTSDMTKFTYQRIQTEAHHAIETLQKNKVAGFHLLFLSPAPFIYNFDHILRISSADLQTILKEDKEQEFVNHSGYSYPVLIWAFGELIEKCIGNRIKLLGHELPNNAIWSVRQTTPNFSSADVKFGFVIDQEAVYKLVEKCDTQDTIRAKAFKELWGEKSQLRRFKDGTMCETVSFEDKRQILFQMMAYIFHAHLDLKPGILNLRYIDCQVENLVERGFVMIRKLKHPKQMKFIKGKRQKPSAKDLEEPVPVELDLIFNKAYNAFDDLSKALRSLEGLPLEVSTVQGTSSMLRFTSVHPTPPQHFPPTKSLQGSSANKKSLMMNEAVLQKVPKVVEPIVVILHLETSGKWPDDMAAVERLKCAFLSRIGQSLEQHLGLVVQLHPHFIDVLKDGFIFRIKLTYYRELTLLKEHLGSDGILKLRDTPESLRLEKETLLLPQLTTTLHSFHRQHPAFGKSCRLAKRWIASQLLLASPVKYLKNPEHPDCRFTEESIELLVAHLFLSHVPYLSPPHEAQLGFLRFLFLLSNTDWKATPIILNFHDKLTKEEVSAIELDFVKRRDQLPPLFIATPEDKSNSVWTRQLSPILLFRIQLLAKEALNVLMKLITENNIAEDQFEKKVKKVFRTDTHEFDLLIHLKKDMNPRSSDNIDAPVTPRYQGLASNTSQDLFPIIDFDPVQIYMSELQSAFGNLALFLHDTDGGRYIAVVWKPDAFNGQTFSASTASGRRMFKGKKLAADVDEIIESFELLGDGLIDRIERRN